jgi:histidinol phosphatase-like enzyme (inositol monophosphatase family)
MNEPLLHAVSALATLAGDEANRHFRQGIAVEFKGDGSPVTAADRAAETVAREWIRANFPDDGILGEEFGIEKPDAPRRWVLDPIDGTKSFISGIPLYTTLVAVMKDDQPLIGVIYAPATGEIVYAAVGGPTWFAVGDGAPIKSRVSSTGQLAEATFVTTEVSKFDRKGSQAVRSIYNHLEKHSRLTRTWGDAYGFLLVATGRADVMVDLFISLWDAAALKPVIEGAGGHYSDWKGLPSVHTGNAVATNRHLAGVVLELTQSA